MGQAILPAAGFLAGFELDPLLVAALLLSGADDRLSSSAAAYASKIADTKMAMD